MDRATIFAHSFKHGVFQLLTDRVRFVPNKRAFVEVELWKPAATATAEMEMEVNGGAGARGLSLPVLD